MDSKTAAYPTPDSLAAMFQNASIDKTEKSEFSNSACDMFKLMKNNYPNFTTKEGENLVFESPDVIDHLRKIVPLFVAEILKNDQSRSSVSETTNSSSMDGSDSTPRAATTGDTIERDQVDTMDIVPPEPSSSPVASVADRYTRAMLKCLTGYPLYDPRPLSELSKEYLCTGVNVGDVGFVRGDGTFEFLFNVCASKNGLIGPPIPPNGFTIKISDHSATRNLEPLPRGTCLFQTPVTRTKCGEYICEGSEGAILELPEGAIQDEAMNMLPFEKLAARHGVEWYEYTMNRGRAVSNGSLYLITSFTKCSQWGMAVFDRPCASGQGLKFERKSPLRFGKSTSKYHWKGSPTFPTKVSNSDQTDEPNQCVFLRGYKLMIRQDIFNNLCKNQSHGSDPVMLSPSQPRSSSPNQQRVHRIRDGGGTVAMSKRLTELLTRTTLPTVESEKVVLRSNFNSSLVHPSDVINTALLSQNPVAKVALTHDDVWCNLLRDNPTKIDYMTLINTARSYTSTINAYYCVSLRTKGLYESSCPLQENETPPLQDTIQRNGLTASDGGYTLVPKASLTLPRELVERILLCLDAKSMLRCRLVNREFNDIIQTSTLLQYFLTCKVAGVIDNPRSPLSYPERLEALEKREDAWRKLNPVFETTIATNQQSPSLYNLTAGTYLCQHDNMKDILYCHFPSSAQDTPQWNRIPGHGPVQSWSGILVSASMAVYEHDLIVNAICSEVENQTDIRRQSLDLLLLKFSTGEYHPLACHPQIHVQKSTTRHEVFPQIVGDNIALLVRGNSGYNADPDRLFIFDWKTGHKRLQHEATATSYSQLIFISPELLLVPNLTLSYFEVWYLPSLPNPDPPSQILSLKIPSVSNSYSLAKIWCTGQPSPFLQSIPYFPPRPFFSSSENSIIVIKLFFISLSLRNASYVLIMHRRALRDTIQKWMASSLCGQQDPPTLLTNEVNVHNIADPGDGPVILTAQSKLVSMNTYQVSLPGTHSSSTYSTSPTSYAFLDSCSSSISSTDPSTSRYDFRQVQWSDWGPPISRLFETTRSRAWNMNSAGQRCAFMFPKPGDRNKSIISVANFNPLNFRRNLQDVAREGEDNITDDGNEEKKGEELELLEHGGVFSEDVYMGLKYVSYPMPGEHDFNGLLMDEERLLGLKHNHNNSIESIKVLYFG